MATTAILSALAEEQQGLLGLLEYPRTIRRAGREFQVGGLHGQPVVLALSRIGKVAAATTATTLIEAFAVDRIVFTGVAGGLGDGLRVGDVVVATHFVQHDMDASPLFPRFEVPLYRQSQFACDAGLTSLLLDASRYCLQTQPGPAGGACGSGAASVHLGLIASGDSFISTMPASTALRLALQAVGLEPLAVEMEGAAVAQVCLDYGVPFAAVRTISDRADDQAPMDFQRFVTEVAGAYALRIMDRFLRSLPLQAPGPVPAECAGNRAA